MAQSNRIDSGVELASEAKGFGQRLRDRMQKQNTLVCIGLDPQLEHFPEELREQANNPNEAAEAVVRFNMKIVEATADLACAFKLNLGFYLPFGPDGVSALLRTRRLIPADVPVILDAKVGDIGHTATAYASAYFDAWGFDAVTISPYLGEDSLEPFLTYPDRGVITLVRTSNPRSGQLQGLPVSSENETQPLFAHVAKLANEWEAKYPASVAMVVGATYPSELEQIRTMCPTLPILLPGVGAQGGDLEAAVRAGIDSDGLGLMVSASRSITYASKGSDYAGQARKAATELRDAINAVRAEAAAS